MNIKQALFNAMKKLQNKKITYALLDAEVILGFVVNKSREFIFAHPEKELTAGQLKRFNSLIDKRAAHYPVAYITNNKKFFGLDFFVEKNVLIPRPDTELLVEETIKTAKQQNSKTIADIGTGSGCMAISIAKNISTVRVIATDISASAIKIAKRNAKRHNVFNRIKFYQGNLFEPIIDKKIDVLIANLPYLPGKKINSLKYEPQGALYAKKNGLALYNKLFQQIAGLKHKPKFILIEIDPRQTTSIEKIIKKYLPKTTINILKDLSGRNRTVKIQLD